VGIEPRRSSSVCALTAALVVRKWAHGNTGCVSFRVGIKCLAMAFAQLTGRDGSRDIEVCLQSQRDKLYRMGFGSRVSRSTLADANANRSFLIYQDFGLHLIARARRLYQHEPFALDLKHVALALDSTTIALCLSVVPLVTLDALVELVAGDDWAKTVFSAMRYPGV